MTSTIENTVYMLFKLCFDKLSEDDQAKLLHILALTEQTMKIFYQHISAIKITSDNTEEMAVKKAIKSKVVSWYNREYKKLNPPSTETKQYKTVFIPKKKTQAGPKVNKKDVVIIDPKLNNEWKNGVTHFCMNLVSVGLASFGTFSSYFVYHHQDDANAFYVMKLMTNKEEGGKKIVWVRN